MQYQIALRYLYSFLNFERIPFRYQRELNLRRMACLLNWFGHPEKAFASVVIAGTKGKGSTANFLASILSAHGHATGLYTSPHLMDPCERIRVDGRMISKRDFVRLLSFVRPVIERKRKEIISYGEITFFELFTLIAILYFAEWKVAFGIFEVGMGGRLDATNILKPLVSVITSISFDHEEHLGHTLFKIAREKAAIIKNKGWVVSARQKLEVRRVIQAEITKRKAKGLFLGSSFRVFQEKLSVRESRFNFEFGQNTWKELQIKLPGRFQVENAGCALAAACVLEKRSRLTLSDSAIKKGLLKAFWPGRFEVLKRGRKTIVLDGAHNDASMKEVLQAVKAFFPRKKCIVIFGISREKNLVRVLEPLLTRTHIFIATKSDNPRAQEPKVILETLSELGFKRPTLWAENLSGALRLARPLAVKESALLITGSLFLVGQAREILRCPK